jgi:hypothetical protein
VSRVFLNRKPWLRPQAGIVNFKTPHLIALAARGFGARQNKHIRLRQARQGHKRQGANTLFETQEARVHVKQAFAM